MIISLEGLPTILLVFVRMSGMILFNPMLSRKNVPNQVRMGLVLCLTILLSSTIESQHLLNLSDLEIVFAVLKELSLGFVCGFVFQIFYYLLFFIGDILDVQFGMSMAKIFDPGTNIQMSISGNLLSFLFILFIFATDSHLLLIKLFASSYKIIPVGAIELSANISKYLIELFINAFSLAIRLVLPFVITEFIVEMSMGILMKLVPQIHVFVINIQTKMVLGIILLFLFAQPLAAFLDNYIMIMFKSIEMMFHATIS